MRYLKDCFIIIVLDTSILTDNLGDYIIMESINKEIKNILNKIMDSGNIFLFTYNIPTHSKLTAETKKLLSKGNVIMKIIGGTNLFRLNYLPPARYNLWKVSVIDLKYFSDSTLLFGVGTTIDIWRNRLIESISKYYSKTMWKRILIKSSTVLHSVRDKETLKYLKDLGFENVVNTGCPTLWDLTPQHTKIIPKDKSDNVIFTLTGHNPISIKKSSSVLKILADNYEKIYFWPQSENDYFVLKNLIAPKLQSYIIKKINVLPPNLTAYDEFLKLHTHVDYIGFRLHAGIRALQFKKRTTIIAIDSRALSFKRDFNLPVIHAKDIDDCLNDIIDNNFDIKINLSYSTIDKFKEMLKNYIMLKCES